MTITKPPITFVQANPANYSAGRMWNGKQILFECVVIHTTAGGKSIAALDNWFQNPAAQASTHFGVGQDGMIHQYVAIDDKAFSHGNVRNATARLVAANEGVNPNLFAVGIEHLDGGVPGTITQPQFEASCRLAAWLFGAVILPNADITGAAIDRDHVIGHCEIDAITRKNCPSWSEQRLADYIARVRTLLTPPVPKPTIEQVQIGLIDKIVRRDWKTARDDLTKIVGA